jgi:GntR family transcriptional regulator
MNNVSDQASTNYPTYHGVKLEMLEHIAKFDRPGQRLPSERVWCDLLHVSRSTVRQALQALEIEGRIQRKRGSGWYVSAPPLRFDPSNHIPFTYTAIQQGRMPSWHEIKIEKAIPSSEIATSFGIRSNRRVAKIQVLLELDSVPVGLETDYFNPLFCSDPSEINHALPLSDELHRILGSRPHYQRVSIKSTNCGAYAANLMGVHAESPALLMMQWINSNKGLAICVSETIWRANALEFIVELPEDA